MSGPAVNPSRDIATSSTTLLIASLLRFIGAAVRRRHEKVGVDPDVLTSPREPEARRLAPSWA